MVRIFIKMSAKTFVLSWKYNIRKNVNSGFSIVTIRRVAIIFFELGVIHKFMQTF